jgi:hypothetical protein
MTGTAQAHRAPVISLSGLKPVGEGWRRLVYAHPHDPNLLIKVTRPDLPKKSHLSLRWRRWGRLRNTAREVHEFLALHGSSPDDAWLVEFVHGFCQTDLGLGLVVEALRTPQGDIAPALSTLLRQGMMTDEIRNALHNFLEDLQASELILGDFWPTNIVYAFESSVGASRFVIVDGIGEKLFIPMNTLSRSYRWWNRRRQIRRLLRDLEEAERTAYSAATLPAIT